MKFKYWVTIIIMFVPAIVAASIKDYKMMGIFAGVSSVTVVFINIDRLKSINAFGIKAEMRNVINEANATIEQMKELQTTITKVVLNLMCKRRYIFTNDLAANVESIRKLLESAKKIDNQADVLIEVKKAMAKLVGLELSDLLKDMDIPEREKKIISDYYHEDASTNLFIDGKKIPSLVAIKEYQSSNDVSHNKKEKENFENYKFILNEYEKLFGRGDFTDHICLENIKKQLENREYK